MKRVELVSKDQDKENEKELVKDAFRSCGYPEWVVQKDTRKKETKKEEEIHLARVSVPYNKGLSERFAKTMKSYKVDTIHKPTSTIKNVLCSRAKDRLHPMDKPGVIYSIKCNAHNNHYVGQTGRAAKERFYEHRVMTHEESKMCHSLSDSKKKEIAEEEVSTGLRRSSRATERKDYKAMNSGSNQLLSVGDTVVSKHMALNDHKPGDIEIKLLDFEPNWKRRLKKETIAINRMTPDLNGNEGQYISPIFDPVPTKFSASGGTRPRHPDATRPDATSSRSRDLEESNLQQSQHRRSSSNGSDDELRT